MELLKNFDVAKIIIWVAPGVLIVLFRSFVINGTFPKLDKDSIAGCVVASAIYVFLIVAAIGGVSLTGGNTSFEFGPLHSIFLFFALPIVLGLLLGFIESIDLIGRMFRWSGVSIPSPTLSAWETMFRELEKDTVMLVTLKNGAMVWGRWTSGASENLPDSSSSRDRETLDLYVAQVGVLDSQGEYAPVEPTRGIYIAKDEIRFIEVMNPKAPPDTSNTTIEAQ